MGQSKQSRARLSLCRRRMRTCRTSRGGGPGRGGPAARAEAAEGARWGRPHSQGGGQRLPLQKVSDGSHLFHEEMRTVELPATQEVVLAAVACADPPEVESCCAQGDEEIFPTDLHAAPRPAGQAHVRGGAVGSALAVSLPVNGRVLPILPLVAVAPILLCSAAGAATTPLLVAVACGGGGRGQGSWRRLARHHYQKARHRGLVATPPLR